MTGVAFDRGLLDGGVGFNLTLTNFTDVISDPLYREVALTTFQIATAAMIVQLLVAIPLAYVIAFKAGRWQLPILLFLVLADELNPMVRIYAWRMLLGREGLINEGLMSIGIINAADRRAPVQPVRGHAGALDQLPDLHGDPDLRRDEGDRRQRLRGRPRPRRRLVDDDPAGAAAADRARDLRLAAARLHPAVHRLRQPGAGRRHERLHARQRRQRPRPRVGRPQPRRGDEHHHAGAVGAVRRRSPTGSAGSTGWRADGRREPLRRRDRRRRPQRPRRRLLPGPGRPQAADPRAPRVRRRLLRDRGVRARLPRLDRRLRDQHAARAGLARHAAGRARHRDRHRRAVPLRLPGRRAAAARRRHPRVAGRDRAATRAADARGPARVRGRPRPARRGRRAADGHDAAEPRPRRPGRAPGAAASWPAPRASTAPRSTTRSSSSPPRATQYLGECFESDVVMAALGWHAINDSIAGPSTPGTAYVLLHDHAAEQAGGGLRTWGFVRGGIGRVTEAMADAAREAGAEIRTSAPRSSGSSSPTAGRRGVELADGDRDRGGPRALQRRSAAHLLRPRRRGPPAGPTSPPRSATTAARARA